MPKNGILSIFFETQSAWVQLPNYLSATETRKGLRPLDGPHRPRLFVYIYFRFDARKTAVYSSNFFTTGNITSFIGSLGSWDLICYTAIDARTHIFK
jgi:hypothetical protein